MTSSPDNAQVEAIVESILRYLSVRPHAADTVDGIHQWWVDWGAKEQSPAMTECALQILKERGLMDCVELGGRHIWRAKH